MPASKREIPPEKKSAMLGSGISEEEVERIMKDFSKR